MIEQILEKIGLTKGEINVYLTLLKLGETTTGKIIEKAQISSGKIYEILDKLIKKGLVSFIVKEKTKYFTASSPNRIVDFIHEQEAELQSNEKELKKELPRLLEMQEIPTDHKDARLFKGFKGIQTAIFEALDDLNQNDEVLAMGIVSSKSETYNTLWQNWHIQRIKKGIMCKAIFSDKNTDYYKSFKKMKHAKIKVLEGITPSPIDVMGNRVLIFTYGGEPSCLLIHNKEIAESFKSFFNTMWKIAK